MVRGEPREVDREGGLGVKEEAYKEAKRRLFDASAPARARWRRKNRYYYAEIEHFLRQVIPPGQRVLELGCGTGETLAALEPSRGLGIDFSPEMVRIAREAHPGLEFRVDDAETFETAETFDYVVCSDLLSNVWDIQAVLRRARRSAGPHTRLVITNYNVLWEPVLRAGEALGMKMRTGLQNWLSLGDLANLLRLENFEVVKRGFRLLLPRYVPLLAELCNRVLCQLPVLWRLSLVQVVVARPWPSPPAIPREEATVTVLVPCLNERGNIEDAVRRTPAMGRHTEILFVDGGSKDGTIEEVQRVIEQYRGRKEVRLLHQGDGKGKGDAVRKGFAAARGDVLMILDADLTVAPEDLPKFFDALVSGGGEFVNGARLVYPMADRAMPILNLLANKFFGMMFSWTLEQPFKDTLCGTKVLFRRDYERIAAGRGYFGDFDPFGDFDLIFGAARLNLKIVEVPIRYQERTYGVTKISRFRHGWLLLRMSLLALRKLKFA